MPLHAQQAYWGEPDAGWQGMFTHQVRAWRSIACHWVLLGIALRDSCTALAADLCLCACLDQVGEVAIVHTHGPKPEMSLCVIEYLQRNVKKKLGWEPKHVIHRKNEIVEHCGIQVRGGRVWG